MNTFAIIEIFKTFEKVNFYTVRLEIDQEPEELSETDKFLLKFNDGKGLIYEEFGVILKLIKIIGRRGAKDIFFRFEDMALALPSKPSKRIAGVQVMMDSTLRLYCVKISESIVILCNGGIKTTHKATDCPNVSSHFRLANLIAKKVYEQLKIGMIRLDEKTLISDDPEIGFYI